ncbi:TRAP-type C4-dicarboxylate transport system permease small subunit [Amorphus suaedae]
MPRAYHRLLDVLEYIPGMLIGLIAIAIGIDVFLRNLGFIGLKGMLELIEYSLFAMTFIGITPALRRGAHVSVDMLLMRTRGRTRRVLSAAVGIISIAISATVCFSAWTALADAWSSGSMVYKNFVFPEWVLFAVILAGMLLFTVELVRQLVRRSGDGDAAPHETITV